MPDTVKKQEKRLRAKLQLQQGEDEDLEDQDLVESRWEDSETGRKRKYYALKSAGRKALRQQKEQWALINSVLNQFWKPHHA